MNKLVLTGVLRSKLSRLETGVENLYFAGVDPSNLASKLCVAVVGTRKPTPYGKDITEKIVADLVREGAVIISGLAFGIDILAHQTAIKQGGETIAVLPSDVDHIYPASHRRIAEQIVANGALVSEHANNPSPRREAFLHRNRIIAALSDAVFIPEAAERSGSLNTASHAEKIGISLFAAPGRTTDPMSAGTNHLLKTGKAVMATTTEDILRGLHIKPTSQKKALEGNDTHETAILIAIQSGIHDTTMLQQELLITTTKLQTTLAILEINGQIRQSDTGQWAIL